jgi:hypothetical protein
VSRAPRWLAALALLLAAVPAAAAGRAVWVWDREAYPLLEDERKAARAAAFLRSAGVDRVYLYADAFDGRNFVVERPQLYGALIRRLRAQGIGAHALLGSWQLRTHTYVRPQRRGDALAMLDRVLLYNALAPADERFEGISLDIEPQHLDEWPERMHELLGQFLDLGAALMEMKQARAAALPLGPAIPFWLDGVMLDWRGKTRPVSEHVQDLFDFVVLMDYRDRADGPDGMIEHARTELAHAERIGRTLVIGVEVSPNEIGKVTFDEETPADFERELGAVEAAFARSPAFGGFVIHHYKTYRRWLRRTRE